MNPKILASTLLIFVLSSCQFFWPKKVEFVPLDAQPLPIDYLSTAFDDSLKLDKDYISHFRLDGFTKTGQETQYLTEKEKLVSAYNRGERSLNLIRAYIYLTGLEGDFTMKNTLEKELCELYPDVCGVAVVQASVSGVVRNSVGKPISNAVVEVLGTNHKTTTDASGKYSFDFNTHSPAVLRLRASTNSTMIDVKKIEIDDGIRKSFVTQKFEKNFTLITPFATHQIDTTAKTISGRNAEVAQSAFIITTPYTKYTIPFGTIMNGDRVYEGKLKAMVFEFDRSSGGILLDADAFDSIEGFAASLFVTHGMPYIILIAEDGTRLDVLSTNPMFIATTLRERDDFMRTKRFDILYKMAYDESQKQANAYPITTKWLFDNGNLRIMPPWWVLDRSTGFWDNVGFRFATTNPDSPYNIEAPFYTIRVGKR
jgi:Carboxypeptidase regulatory-like domain